MSADLAPAVAPMSTEMRSAILYLGVTREVAAGWSVQQREPLYVVLRYVTPVNHVAWALLTFLLGPLICGVGWVPLAIAWACQRDLVQTQTLWVDVNGNVQRRLH